jgi:hypothetical protein
MPGKRLPRKKSRNFSLRRSSYACCPSQEEAIMHRSGFLTLAAALTIGIAQVPMAASAHGGGGHTFAGAHFGGERGFSGGHFDPRFDRQFGRFRGRAFFGVGGVFLGYDFGYGLGYGYPGYYPAWNCSQYPYGYNPAVGCYYRYPGPAY